MISDDKKLLAAELLRQKYKQLGRLPRKDDFDEPTRSRIKSFLGPWPRALEAAGLKAAKPQEAKSKKKRRAAVKSKNPCFTAKQRLETKRKLAKKQGYQSKDKSNSED